MGSDRWNPPQRRRPRRRVLSTVASLRREGSPDPWRPSSWERPSCGRLHASPAPARVAAQWLASLRYSPVEAPSRVVGCGRAVLRRPGRRSRAACLVPRSPMPHRPGSATNIPRAPRCHRVRRICDSASDVDARSTLLHLDWSAVNGPSFRCRAQHRLCESHAHAPNPLFLVSCMAVNKKQPFRRMRDEKTSRRAQCDASMSHKTAATSLSRRLFQNIRSAQTRLSIGTKRRFSGPT
jgi:hypothetical protein